MQKDDVLYLGHMLDTARAIVGKLKGKSRAEFDANDDLRLALAHLIQTLGEAARRVSPEFQRANPQVPWKKIVGMRHKVVHDYLHVNYNIVWTVATIDLLPLLAELERMAPPEPPESETSSNPKEHP
jgi:uncharacterized protein with HEPN domain